MISDLPTAVLGKSLAAEDTLLKLSKGGESRLPSCLQTNSKGHRQSKEDPQFRTNSLQRRAVPPPSHFRLVPWSLHFLGITLTVQSAELLQICKWNMFNIRKYIAATDIVQF
jgi:hypothetical protein